MTPFDKVLDTLNVERRNGSSAEAHCPAHDDNQASLSVSEGREGKVLLKCHAGCSTEEVIAAAGLEWSDLFPQKKRSNGQAKKRKIVARYPYTDADGETLFEVIRFEPKAFSQFTPGKGWGRKKHGVDTTLYRLPSVLEAAENGRTVFIVEGEKDVHTLEDMGFVATTCPQGTHEWEDRFSDHLSGAHVVLLPDNDDEGVKHAGEVARSVWEPAEDVRIVELDDVPPKGDITDWHERGHTADELKQLVQATNPLDAPPADPDDSVPDHAFWYVDEEKGRVGIDRGGLLEFLKTDGFGKVYAEDDLSSTLVRVQQQVVSRTSRERIKDYVIKHIRDLDPEAVPGSFEPSDVEAALLRGANVYFSEALFEFLPVLDLDFKRDEPGTSFFYYENGFVEVTAKGFNLHDYSDLDGAIWEDQIIDRPFTSMQGDSGVLDSDWHRFLRNVAAQDDSRWRALTSSIGYLLHGYKNPARSKAIVFMDEADSDVPNGRTGKSVVAKGVAQMVPTTRIDARNFSFDSRFAFQSVQLGTRVVDFNDAGKRFDFERLFSCVTDDWQIERKGRDQMTIGFSEAPKIVISTNYVLEGEGASFEDRVFQVEFHPHYTTEHKPEDDFGRRFFDQWDQEAWAHFDNIMIACVREYLRDGLHDYRRVNVDVRRLKQQTCPDFAEWILAFIELGRDYEKDALWRTFKDEYAPDYEDLTKRKFDYWCRSFARIYDLELNRDRRRDDGVRKRYMEFKTRGITDE